MAGPHQPYGCPTRPALTKSYVCMYMYVLNRDRDTMKGVETRDERYQKQRGHSPHPGLCPAYTHPPPPPPPATSSCMRYSKASLAPIVGSKSLQYVKKFQNVIYLPFFFFNFYFTTTKAPFTNTHISKKKRIQNDNDEKKKTHCEYTLHFAKCYLPTNTYKTISYHLFTWVTQV